MFTPLYSWNTAKSRSKHQSINILSWYRYGIVKTLYNILNSSVDLTRTHHLLHSDNYVWNWNLQFLNLMYCKKNYAQSMSLSSLDIIKTLDFSTLFIAIHPLKLLARIKELLQQKRMASVDINTLWNTILILQQILWNRYHQRL